MLKARRRSQLPVSSFRSFAVLLLAAATTTACATVPSALPETFRLPSAAEARKQSSTTSDPETAADLAWFLGNDRRAAREHLDRGLTARPRDPSLLLRRAMLGLAELDEPGFLRDTLALLEAAPGEPEAEALLLVLIDRLPSMIAEKDRIAKTLDDSRLWSRGPATHVALASLLRARIARVAGDRALAGQVLERAGWLRRFRAVGPIGPESQAALREPQRVEIEGISGPVPFRGFLAPVRTIEAPGATVVPVAGELSGLYVAETWFEVAKNAGGEPLVLQVNLNDPGRIAIDGRTVLERRTSDAPAPSYLMNGLELEAGWHRLTVAMLGSGADGFAVSLLTARGEPALASPASIEPPAGTGPGTGPDPDRRRAESRDRDRDAEMRSALTFLARAERLAAEPKTAVAGLFLGGTIALSPWAGDVEAARRFIRRARQLAPESGAAAALDARLLAQESTPPSVVQASLRRALELDPTHPSALVALGRTLATEDRAHALALADRAKEAAAASSEPDRLRFEIQRARGWNAEALESLRAALAKRETAELLEDGARFLRSLYRTEEAAKLEERAAALNESGAYVHRSTRLLLAGDAGAAIQTLLEAADGAWIPAEPLSRAAELHLGKGAVKEAIAALDRALAGDPLHGKSLRLLAIARARLGELDAARAALERLRAIGSDDLELELFLARISGRAAGEPQPKGWLAKTLEVDPHALARAPADPQWAGSKRVRLLDRVVDHVRADGHALSLRHVMVRLLTKEATDEAGEFRLEGDSMPLVLRTIKADGRVVDVDRHSGKEDLSFSALAPGDAVEQQWLTIDDPLTGSGGYMRQFYFQDETPNLRSELAVVVPRGTKVSWHGYNGAPEPEVKDDGDETVYYWRASDVPGVVAEPASTAPDEFLPFVAVTIGLDAESAARANRSPFEGIAQSSFDLRERARALIRAADAEKGDELAKSLTIYRWVIEHVRHGSFADPQVVLATRRGNRTGLMLAMLRAVGLDAELALGRPGAAPKLSPAYPDPHAYYVPLIRVNRAAELGPIWIRADQGSSWLGRATPDFRSGSYLLLGGPPAPKPFSPAEVERWAVSSSVDFALDQEGNAKGTIALSMPGQFGQGLKQALKPLRQEDLYRALEGWLSAFLPGAAIEKVDIEGQDDSLAPLELKIAVAVASFLANEGDVLVANRFFDSPIGMRALSLPELEAYLEVAERKTPLFVREAEEKMEVRIRLPGSQRPLETPSSFELDTKYGRFFQRFHWDAKTKTATLVRSDSINASRVSAADFPAFRELAQDLALRTRNRLVLQSPRMNASAVR